MAFTFVNNSIAIGYFFTNRLTVSSSRYTAVSSLKAILSVEVLFLTGASM